MSEVIASEADFVNLVGQLNGDCKHKSIGDDQTTASDNIALDPEENVVPETKATTPIASHDSEHTASTDAATPEAIQDNNETSAAVGHSSLEQHHLQPFPCCKIEEEPENANTDVQFQATQVISNRGGFERHNHKAAKN